MRRMILSFVLVAVLPALPARADDGLLRQAFSTFLRSAEALSIDAVPDLYDGGYARITVTGRRVLLNTGLRVDEATVRLVGVSLDPEALRAGTLKVLDLRESALQVKVLLRNLQDFFNERRGVDDFHLWAEGGYLLGAGTAPFRGQMTPLRLKGFFAVSGTTEIYFYFDTVHANGFPVPTSVIREIERRINPVVHQREWPVTFKIRSVQLDTQTLRISSQGSGTCPTCGGGEQPTLSP